METSNRRFNVLRDGLIVCTAWQKAIVVFRTRVRQLKHVMCAVAVAICLISIVFVTRLRFFPAVQQLVTAFSSFLLYPHLKSTSDIIYSRTSFTVSSVPPYSTRDLLSSACLLAIATATLELQE